MADKQLIKYSGSNYGANYSIKNAIYSIKTAKNYDDLEQALTINFLSQLNVYIDSIAEQFAPFHRGYLQSSLGQGIRFIETYGLLQVKPFKPLQPGSKACLEVPNNLAERAETITDLVRVYCSNKMPDFLDAYNKFVDPNQLYTFTSNKIGNIRNSIAVFLNILYSYILSICPWADDKTDHFNSHTILSILGAKWENTPISVFGDEREGIGALLESLTNSLKKEIDKEKALKNVSVYSIWQWCPRLIKANDTAEMKVKTKAKKPTNDISKDQLKKMYYDNQKVDPHLAAASFCRCMLYHIEQMIGEVTAKNDSQFPGNLENKQHEYGKEKTTMDLTACPQKGSGKRAETKSLYNPTKINEEDLVIIMNSELYKEIKSASYVSGATEAGAYKAYISNFMKYDKYIIKLDSMPYGAVKFGSKHRYNIWDLYDHIEVDRVGQHDLVVHTAHKAVAFGIREYRPFRYIRLTGLSINPSLYDEQIEFTTPTDL